MVYTVEDGAFVVEDGAFVSYRVIEDFEGGDLTQFCDPPASGFSDVRAAAALSGDFGLYQEGFDFVGTVEGENGHPGPFPAPGDTLDVFARFPDANDVGGGFMRFFAMGLGTTGACDSTDDMGARFEIQWDDGAVGIYDSVSGTKRSASLSASTWPSGEITRMRIDWDDSTSPNTVRAEPFDSGDNSLTGGTTVTLQSDHNATNRGFGFRNSGVSGEQVHWDDARIVP